MEESKGGMNVAILPTPQAQYHLNLYMKEPLAFTGLRLVQIGRMHCKPSTVIGTHVHLDWFELTVVTDGEGTVSTDGVPTTARRGDIYLSYPCDAHKIESHPARPLRYDFFAFIPTDETLRQSLESIVRNRPLADHRLFRDERIVYLIGCAIAEFCADTPADHSLLDAIFHQITTYLVRDAATLAPDAKSVHQTPSKALCFRIMNHIDTHLYTMSSLAELSELTGYHYSYLSTVFRKTTGTTLADYYHNKRLSSARLLLREGRLSISEIADALGYSSVYAFSKAYRNRFSLSPREERGR